MACVLVADDEAGDREVMAAILAEAGHELHLAADGSEALRIFSRRPIDVVVTDIVMPGHDGVELILDLKRLDPEAEVVAISGKGDTGLHFANLAGASVVLKKPVSADALVAAVERIVSDDPSASR